MTPYTTHRIAIGRVVDVPGNDDVAEHDLSLFAANTENASKRLHMLDGVIQDRFPDLDPSMREKGLGSDADCQSAGNQSPG
jgi:hypothetical protein